MIDRMGNWYPDWPGQQPYQDPAYIRAYGQQGQQQGQQLAHGQMLTLPTIDAKIIQVDDMGAIDRVTITPGAPQMFWTKDEHTIVVRTMYANNQHSDRVWKEQPPEPPAPTLNPADYVRKDELQAILSELLQAQTTPKKAQIKKEEAA